MAIGHAGVRQAAPGLGDRRGTTARTAHHPLTSARGTGPRRPPGACARTLRGFRRPARRGTAVRAACSRWLHRCCGRLRPYCTPSWRHSRVQQRLGRTAPRYYIIRGPGKVHGGAGGGGSGGRNEGAPVGDSPPFVPVSQSWLHRRCAHRGARGRERRRLLFRPGALFTPEGPVHCQVH